MKIENIDVYNFHNAIRGMRNAHGSWDKSDSYWKNEFLEGLPPVPEYTLKTFIIGDEDKGLALKLIEAGTDHRKFLRQIFVSMDITAPRYWWIEMDTYKVGTTANSESTMHTLMKKPITVDMFEVDEYFKEDFSIFIKHQFEPMREEYQEWTKKGETENAYQMFRAIIQSLPQSFLQIRTWTANYEVLRNIYHARENHKLKEWHEFCAELEKLPESWMITEKPDGNKYISRRALCKDCYDRIKKERILCDVMQGEQNITGRCGVCKREGEVRIYENRGKKNGDKDRRGENDVQGRIWENKN